MHHLFRCWGEIFCLLWYCCCISFIKSFRPCITVQFTLGLKHLFKSNVFLYTILKHARIVLLQIYPYNSKLLTHCCILGMRTSECAVDHNDTILFNRLKITALAEKRCWLYFCLFYLTLVLLLTPWNLNLVCPQVRSTVERLVINFTPVFVCLCWVDWSKPVCCQML